jgi:hypothetical protein
MASGLQGAMAWPIQQAETDYVGERESIGFLAVDSANTNAFEEKWDANVGAEIAEQLFVTLWFYQMMDDRLGVSSGKTQREVVDGGEGEDDGGRGSKEGTGGHVVQGYAEESKRQRDRSDGHER